MESFAYVSVPFKLGDLCIVWQTRDDDPKVVEILLPRREISADRLVHTRYVDPRAESCPPIDDLREQMRRFLEGEDVKLGTELLALDTCSGFQRRVLLAEYQIPRGWVSTYGRIAEKLNVPRGARAVGNALARNPFSIIIPCHRAVRSNGALGGFQGGLSMKRALLELERVKFSPSGRAILENVWY